MIFNVHAGHSINGGAFGYLNEASENRKVKDRVINKLRELGHTVYDCTVDSGSASQVLKNIVAKCNQHTVDFDISIHFNAIQKELTPNGVTKGTEVYVYGTSKGKEVEKKAKNICNEISKLGFTNRGVKYSTGLYVLKHTKAPAMLIECCFVDDADDVKLYNVDKMASAIVKGLVGEDIEIDNNEETNKDKELLASMTNEQFVDYIGKLATEDMKKTGILASITTAQAILESGYGKSELALNALNLGGMKANLSGNTWASDWKGKIYTKKTSEQLPNGKYITITADFRAYDSIAEYLKDHSDYLKGAKNGDKLRYEGIIGCKDYRKGFQILKDGGYATSHKYVDNLCRVVENWNLTRFDNMDGIEENEDVYYVVTLGYYANKNNAIIFQNELRNKGIISSLQEIPREYLD